MAAASEALAIKAVAGVTLAIVLVAGVALAVVLGAGVALAVVVSTCRAAAMCYKSDLRCLCPFGGNLMLQALATSSSMYS